MLFCFSEGPGRRAGQASAVCLSSRYQRLSDQRSLRSSGPALAHLWRHPVGSRSKEQMENVEHGAGFSVGGEMAARLQPCRAGRLP